MGNLINFYSPSAANINSLKVHFAPKQNLNGQTKPWPAGGGKNILNMDWFTATNSYIGSTGSTGNMSYYSYTDYLELAPNTYTISGVNNTVNSNLRIHSYDENKEWVKQLASKYLAEGASFSLTFTVTSDDKYIRISAPAKTPENPYLQLEVGSSATAYAPYENICPIEGWESVEANYTGKNLFNKNNITLNYRYNGDADLIYNKNNCISDYIAIKPNTNYYLSGAGDLLINERCVWFDSNKKIISVASSYYSIKTSPSNAAYVRITVHQSNIDTAQFEEGSAATSYEPYGYTYPLTFPVVGKNIIPWINPDGYTVISSYNGNVDWSQPWEVPKSANGMTVTYSATIDNTNGAKNAFLHIWTKNENGQYVDTTICSAELEVGSTGRLSKTITLNTNRYTSIIFGLTMENATASNPMVEYGSTATTYEPYSSNNTIYGGYVDFAAGKVVQTHKIVTFDGTEDWSIYAGRRFKVTMSDYISPVATIKSDIYCNKFEVISKNYSGSNYTISGSDSNTRYIMITVDEYVTTVEQLEDWLEDNPLTVCYPLETPIEYPISPQTLQTFHGPNNIWSNTNSDTEILYDLYETSRLTTIKKRIIAAAPHVNTTSTANTVSFTTDMRAPLPQCKVSFVPRQGGSGTASPTNVRPIYGLKYLSVLNSGKNLVDVSTFTTGKGLNSSGQLQNWDSTMLSPYIPLPGGDYYVSGISRASGTNNLRIHGFDENKQWIKQIIAVSAAQNAEYAGAFDFASSNIKYIRVSVNINTENLQIEQGTTKSQYEPYSGGLWTADWESTAGEVYGGYVNLVTGEVWKTYHKITLDGTTTNCKVNRDYSDNTYIVGGVVYLSPDGVQDYQRGTSKLFCNKMPIITPDTVSNLPYIRTISAGAQYLRIYLANTAEHTDLDTAQKRIDYCNAYLVENPIDIVYPLSTPVLVTTLTPTQLLSFKGTNNLYASHNTITAKYWTH